MPSAIIQLLKNPLTEEFDSVRYLKAGSEVFAFLIAGSWLLTFLFNPEAIQDNGLKDRIGYNNLCVGFDTPPAKYFAFFLWPVCHYFNIRYAWLEVVTEYSLEAKNTSDMGKKITVVASAVFVLSVLLQTFILVFPPTKKAFDVWFHSAFFIQYIFIRLLVIGSQFFKNRFDESSEDEDSISNASWIWFYVFAFSSIGIPVGAFSDFYYYDFVTPEGSKDVLIPWYILNAIDITWFVSLATTAKYLPAHRTYRVKSLAKAQTKAVTTE